MSANLCKTHLLQYRWVVPGGGVENHWHSGVQGGRSSRGELVNVPIGIELNNSTRYDSWRCRYKVRRKRGSLSEQNTPLASRKSLVPSSKACVSLVAHII